MKLLQYIREKNAERKEKKVTAIMPKKAWLPAPYC